MYFSLEKSLKKIKLLKVSLQEIRFIHCFNGIGVTPEMVASSLSLEGYAEYEHFSDDKIGIRFRVENMETGKPIKAFELYVYATDIWGNRIYGEETVYSWTTYRTVVSGKIVFSDSVTLPNCSRFSKVHCAIHKVAYEDGTSAITPNLRYETWDWD